MLSVFGGTLLPSSTLMGQVRWWVAIRYIPQKVDLDITEGQNLPRDVFFGKSTVISFGGEQMVLCF